jgi:predicted methyltransferase
MIRQTEMAQLAVRQVIQPGEAAVDATAGNGHDSRFLAELVGPTGRVFALDVQPEAIARTAELLRAAGLANVTLLAHDHADLAAIVPGPVGAVMFNLGYRPGGNKSAVTRTPSTLAGLRAGLGLLRPGGVLTVVAYPGHPGGVEETAAVAAFLHGLPPGYAVIDSPPDGNLETGPRLFVVRSVEARPESGPAKEIKGISSSSSPFDPLGHEV